MENSFVTLLALVQISLHPVPEDGKFCPRSVSSLSRGVTSDFRTAVRIVPVWFSSWILGQQFLLTVSCFIMLGAELRLSRRQAKPPIRRTLSVLQESEIITSFGWFDFRLAGRIVCERIHVLDVTLYDKEPMFLLLCHRTWSKQAGETFKRRSAVLLVGGLIM